MTQKENKSPSELEHVIKRASARIIRCDAVQHRTGLKKSQLYAMTKDGKFPRQVKLGVKAVGWVESEVADWIDSRVQASRHYGLEVV